MIIWLNGAFGAGKSSVARRIIALRPGATLFDPEQIGFLLRRLLPGAGGDDFQDLPLWRELTVRLLGEAETASAGPVIVPMTLVEPGYFEEIVGRLRAKGVELRHFTLSVSAETLRRRLWRRLDWPASKRWALARVDPCVGALAGEMFAEHIDAEGRSIAEIAEAVLLLAEGGGRRACA
jgi:hypothetical protein